MPQSHSLETPKPRDTKGEHLRLSRELYYLEDALARARKALLWLQLAHVSLAQHNEDVWCDDAVEGLAEIFGFIAAFSAPEASCTAQSCMRRWQMPASREPNVRPSPRTAGQRLVDLTPLTLQNVVCEVRRDERD